MSVQYDIAVIGAGPAGLSAALNAAIRQKSVIVFGPAMSEKLQNTELIENYLGMPEVSGPELLGAFRQHVEAHGVTFRTDMVQVVYDMGGTVGILLPGNEMIQVHAVVLATGVNFGKPFPGEKELLGKGVGTCATCDAALYKGQSVIVVGYNEEAVEETNFIAEMASETTFVNMLGRPVDLNPGIRVIDEKPVRVVGTDHAEGLEFQSGVIPADGVFFIRDARAANQIAPGIAMDGAHVVVDDQMATNLKGIFACGDLAGLPYQINTAAGRGQIAGLSAAKVATLRAHGAAKKAK